MHTKQNSKGSLKDDTSEYDCYQGPQLMEKRKILDSVYVTARVSNLSDNVNEDKYVSSGCYRGHAKT